MSLEREQFRILYRQFLFRLADIEALSAHAQGDSNRLIGQFGALLGFVSLVLAVESTGRVRDSGEVRIGFVVASEHFLIALTMLTVGLLAVLCWDSMFPDQRDVLTLTPLPVRARTLFLAKTAALATALGLTVGVLNVATGLLWPANYAAKTSPTPVPSFTFDAAIPPVPADRMQEVMTREMELPLEPGQGIAIGVLAGGQRRTWAYGEARPDTLFEIASITKTFTGLLLAQMAAEGRVRLEDPGPYGIPWIDLATHRSGLTPWLDLGQPADRQNPYAGFTREKLYAWAAKNAPNRNLDRAFVYNNGGYALLGQKLADVAGVSYDELLAERVLRPLGMRDAALRMSAEQEQRFAQGWYEGKPAHRWDLDGVAPAGGLHANVEDLLKYAAAWLDPAQLGVARTIALTPRGNVDASRRIALAWIYEPKTKTYWHNGGTRGFSSYLFFCPSGGYAGTVLRNRGPRIVGSPDLLAEHMRQRLAGEPAVSLRTVVVPGGPGGRGYPRWFAAYWVTMLAAGAFMLCLVLALQGVAALLLPRRLFLRVSGWLQMATFGALLAGAILEPKFPTLDSLLSAEGQMPFAWSPAYWFLGVFHSMNGMTHPALTRLGHAAWTAFGAIAALAAVSYALAYVRTMRQTVEAPEIAPSTGALAWLPRFGGTLATAVAQFSIRTLMRSRQHRLILAFYLGIGLALTVVVLRSPEGGKTPLLLASTLTMGFAVTGMRVVFAMPLDLRANWLWRALPVPGGMATLAARRRALLALAVAPVWAATAVLCFWTLPWRVAGGHVVILGLLGAVAAEVALFGPVKIPFTCSYLPGKSNLHVTLWMCVFGIEILVAKAVEYEARALDAWWGLPAIALPMLAALIALKRMKDPVELRFEEEPADTIVQLKLSNA